MIRWRRNAEIVANETRRLLNPKASLKSVAINTKLTATAFAATASSFDPDFGGIDFNPNRPDGPKFPTPAKLNFVQQLLERTPNADISQLLDMTLMQMACGGIRDHVGGGFHRYSVDRRWNVPHFEKMLYDQAQLADAYVEAVGVSHMPFYKQVAEEIFEFVSREMTSPDGGFYSALDAETDGIEGEYYVWDSTEIDKVLGAASADFKAVYRVKELSDFEHGNVLRLSSKKLPRSVTADPPVASTSENAGKAQSPAGSERDEFTRSRQKLLEVRSQRKKPLRDEKILTSWNGLMIGAYARAASPLQHPEYVRTAERAANFVLTNLRDPQGRLLHTSTNNQAKLNAYLDDYAFFIDGLLALHEATGEAMWLKTAKQLQDDQLRLFLDENNGGFYFTSHHHEELLARAKNCYDGVLPSGNSVSARNLIKLAKLTGATAYRDEARATIELFAPNIEQTPRGFANLALATIELLESEAEAASTTDSQTGDVVLAAGKEEKGAANDPLILLAEQKVQQPKKEEVVRGRAYLSTDKLPAGGTCRLIVLLDVKEGWHINANPPKPENMIPVKISFSSTLGAEMSELIYPKGHVISSDGTEVMVYEGEVPIRGTVTVPEKAGGQMDQMEITIVYQACNDKRCDPPKTIKLLGKLAVAKKGEPIKQINSRLFQPPAKAEK